MRGLSRRIEDVVSGGDRQASVGLLQLDLGAGGLELLLDVLGLGLR